MTELKLCFYLMTYLILCSDRCITNAQDNNITFSPSLPLCIGEEVVMTCFVIPPTAEQFIDTAAQISFNDSEAGSISNINANSIVGADTNRYTADITGLNVAISRPGIRLTITDYQASDGATNFSCHGLYSGGVSSPAFISDFPQRFAAPPSSLVVTLSQTDTNCSNLLISWLTPSSDRSILTYSVYRNDTFLTNTTDNQYTDNTQLSISTVYEYSAVAISCAGTSTAGANYTSIGGFSLTNNPIFLSYDNTSSVLFVDWTLLPFSPLQSILIDYSLVLNYTHSQSDSITNFSSITFQQLSTDTDYTVPLTPHPFPTDDGVVTNITVCLQITQQCGLAFSGVNMCAFFNSGNPPTRPPTTMSTTSTGTIISVVTTSSSTTTSAPLNILPIIIGSVAGVGAILLILIIVLFFITVYVCCIRNRASRSPKDPISQGDRVELATHHTPDSRPEDTYAQVNKPSPSNRPSQKKAAPPPPDLIYAELDHVANSTRVNPSSIPVTNYSDLAQLPDYTTDHTTYATLN